MSRYVIGRIGQAVLVLWAAFTVSFVLLQLLPADGVLIKFLNPELGLSPEQIAEIRIAYGADTPVWQQYLSTLASFLSGDFGYSVRAGVPVTSLLATTLPTTLRLAAVALAVSVLVAAVIAYVATVSRSAWLRNALQSLPSLFISIPVFWLGIALIQVFSFRLKLISVINPGPMEMLVLPVLAIAVPISAPLAQIFIRSIDEVRTRPFVAVARAKGASSRRVLVSHIAGNAILPVLTIGGVLFGELVAGAVITETVFGLNGIGALTYLSVNTQDVAVLQAIVLISAAGFVLTNLIVDLLYPVFDPRLRNPAGASA